MIVWVLSDGQLIRLAMSAAKDLDIEIIVLGQSIRSSVGRLLWTDIWPKNIVIVPDRDGKKDWGDHESLVEFARLVWEGNAVTTEWENISHEVLRKLVELGLIARPHYEVIELFQDRLKEKQFTRDDIWLWTVWFVGVNDYNDIYRAFQVFNRDIIIKTRRNGYDGKGQFRIQSQEELERIWNVHLEQMVSEWHTLIAEERLRDMNQEISVIVWRWEDGSVQMFDPILNIHENGILRYSISPAPQTTDMKQKDIFPKAKKIAQRVMDGFSKRIPWWYVGLLTIEMFVTENWEIFINEFAPRPHNSGHATLDSHNISQNHLWIPAVAGKSLDTRPQLKQRVMMENILSQRELARVIELGSYGNLTWKLYDYQKILCDPNPNDTAQRKLAHLNHFWSHVDIAIEQYEKWEITIDQLTDKIKAL